MEPALYFEKGDSRRTFSYPLYSCYVQHSDNNTLIRKRFVSHLDKMVDYLNRVDISKVINEQLSIRIRRKLKFVSLANDTFIWEFRLLLSNRAS